MKKILLIGIVMLALLGGTGYLWLRQRSSVSVALAITQTPVPTATVLPTLTSTVTLTASPTATATSTSTLTPSPTNTLSTLVLKVTVVNRDVTLDPVEIAPDDSATATPPATLSIPTPSDRIASLPTGETLPVGWFQQTIPAPAVQVEGRWELFSATYRALHRHYLYSDDADARLIYRFLGAAMRVRYVAYFSYGVFQILIDGQVRATIDSYHSRQTDGRGNFLSTEVFGLPFGWHTLEIVRMGRKAPESRGTIIAIESIDVYLNGSEPTQPPTDLPITPTFTASPAPAERIQVIAAPPTVQPTATAVSPGVVAIDFSLAYDANGNKAIDPSEGVQGIPVRLVTADTNQVLVSSYTNAEGFVHLEAMTNAPGRLVVPYFNKYWDIPARSGTTHLTLIIPAANQPGLIP